MHKILNPIAIGVSGRQSELIELALTYGFQHLEVDLLDFQRRSEQQGQPAARRLFDSAKLAISGCELPLALGAPEPAFRAALAACQQLIPLAQSLGVTRCWTTLEPATDERPFHENFELHRKRLVEVTDLLDRCGIQLGVGLAAAASHRAPRAFQFIYQPDQLLLLLKTVGASNLGVVLDVWDWHVGGATPEQVARLSASQVVAVRLADLPADADLATVTDEQRLLPGDSPTIDCAAILRQLAERDYAGPVSVTPHPSQLAGLRREAVVQRLSTTIDALWSAAGLDKHGKLIREQAGT